MIGQRSSSKRAVSTSYQRGLDAEHTASVLLEAKNYEILGHRYRNAAGEIDLIARRGDHIAFIEVKRRKTQDEAAWSILPRQQARIASAAEGYLAEHLELGACTASFDVVFVTPKQGCAHIENAFLA